MNEAQLQRQEGNRDTGAWGGEEAAVLAAPQPLLLTHTP